MLFGTSLIDIIVEAEGSKIISIREVPNNIKLINHIK
jgi:hypothetical protein